MDLVLEDDICGAMVRQLETTAAYLNAITDAMSDRRYAPGKWTLREVVGHLGDTERIYGFRLLTFARGDSAVLSHSDQDLYVREAAFDRHPLGVWLEQFLLVRRSHLALLQHLPPGAWARTGTVAGFTVSVRAMAYLMVGHERHHLRIIQDHYLAGA
jgi:hypothetical protein